MTPAVRAASSSARTVTRLTSWPSSASMLATRPAPPARRRMPATSTTGTGASGQSRVVSPVDVDVEQDIAHHDDPHDRRSLIDPGAEPGKLAASNARQTA